MEKSLEADRETADMLCTKKLPEVCGAGRESGEQAEMGNGDRKRKLRGWMKIGSLQSGISSVILSRL